MIKTLLNADEDPPPDTAVIIEETVLRPVAAANAASDAPFADAEDILEIPEARLPRDAEVLNTSETFREPQNASEILDALNTAPKTETISEEFKTEESKYGKYENETLSFQAGEYQSETSDETMHKSGLAYAAAIILLGSIVFMLILGWFADLLLGTSPWGIVVGIVLGSIIGFVQFFRTTSQILKK